MNSNKIRSVRAICTCGEVYTDTASMTACIKNNHYRTQDEEGAYFIQDNAKRVPSVFLVAGGFEIEVTPEVALLGIRASHILPRALKALQDSSEAYDNGCNDLRQLYNLIIDRGPNDIDKKDIPLFLRKDIAD